MGQLLSAAELIAGLERRGIKARLVSTARLGDLGERIARLHRQGQFDREFYEERLTSFEFRLPESLPGAKSIVIATVPQQQFRLAFRWRGREFTVTVPPTYLHWQATNARVLSAVTEVVSPYGYRAAAASLPVKTLVVHSGLGAYGRNNLTYVPGLGSFHRPVAVYTDLPADGDWHDAKLMPACEKCRACEPACPTGAIGPERILLHAERCLTFLNEKPGGVPFPGWIRPALHHCLVGCMFCQRACPENRALRDRFEPGPEFSEGETARLLEGPALDRLPADLRAKLEAHDLAEYLDVMPRNLGAIVNRG